MPDRTGCRFRKARARAHKSIPVLSGRGLFVIGLGACRERDCWRLSAMIRLNRTRFKKPILFLTLPKKLHPSPVARLPKSLIVPLGRNQGRDMNRGGCKSTEELATSMRALLSYWHSLARTGGEVSPDLNPDLSPESHQQSQSEARRLPSRQALHLDGLIKHLPHITLIDILSANQWRMRLVGSRARDLLGLVAEQRPIDVSGAENLKPLRPASIEKCLSSGQPQYGIDVSSCGKNLHAWLRLPLSSDGKTPDAVLGFDQTLQAEAVREQKPVRPMSAFLNPASAGSRHEKQTFVA